MLLMPPYALDLRLTELWCPRESFKITPYYTRRDLRGHLVQPSQEDISQVDVITYMVRTPFLNHIILLPATGYTLFTLVFMPIRA